MKFSDTKQATQTVLIGMALSGCLEVLSRDTQDGGRVLAETVLARVGLTADEFKAMINELEADIEKEVEAVINSDQAGAGIGDHDMYQKVAHEFRNVGTEWIKQGLLDRDLISIEEADRMNRIELLGVIVEHRKSLPDLLANRR